MSKRVTPQEAAELMTAGWTYLDVRSIPEFEQGHPAGAMNVPLMHATAGRMVPNGDFQKVIQANFAADTKLVVGCKSGGRSMQAVGLLAALGYENLVDVRGGFGGERDGMGRSTAAGWAEAGLPVATQAEAGRGYTDLQTKV
ncbi:MAG: rhodanese-like domain-containing protein [Deltaproteobacteria bacterium]|nr:rhodanese-like domain-containing protein [Deltaproteobacteria bacterium]